MTSIREYEAFLFRQRSEAPLQVAFIAPSSEIDAWARVPTKRTGNVRNFQRPEIERHVAEVKRFFTQTANASPTAIVVGFDRGRARGLVRVLDSQRQPADSAKIVPGEPSRGFVEISFPELGDPQNVDELRARIGVLRSDVERCVLEELCEISGRSEDQLRSLKSELEPIQAQLLAWSDDVVGDEGEESDSEYGFDRLKLPEATMRHLEGLTPSEREIVLGRLTFLLSISSEAVSRTPEDALRAICAEVVDELKPGLLIDGQHRVKGTQKLGKIPFLVAAMPEASWPELAFQFIVTNRTARKVPESLLISIVGSSLSRAQRQGIEERLREANIRVGLIEAVMQVHEDESSPFHRMIAFGLKDEQGFLDAAAMRGKVIQTWYERRGDVLQLFDHLCQGKKKSDRTEYWKEEEVWFDFFCAFWRAVKDRYAGEAVFSRELTNSTLKIPASRLMSATVLMIFQETVLRHLAEHVKRKNDLDGVAVAASIPDSEEFAKLVKNALVRLTSDFFVGWKITGFDGSKGAGSDLEDAIRSVISGEETVNQLKTGTGKKRKTPHRLFKEEG